VSSNLVDLADHEPIQVWEGVIARRVQGERITLAVVELAPNAIVPEHRHPNEQNGMVIQGRVLFRCGDEERQLGPGGTWRILGDVPHSVVTGPDGAVVIDVFTPIRDDWDRFDVLDQPPVWPPAR
jgi:quercetin dioxygenase-like cupin family protein